MSGYLEQTLISPIEASYENVCMHVCVSVISCMEYDDRITCLFNIAFSSEEIKLNFPA